jgi:hypothetical protein
MADGVEEPVHLKIFFLSSNGVLDTQTLEKVTIAKAFRRNSVPEHSLGSKESERGRCRSSESGLVKVYSPLSGG